MSSLAGLRHIKLNPKHQFGDVTKISRELLELVDKLCSVIPYNDFIITSGYRPADGGSQHSQGLAIDIVFDSSMPLMDIYLAAERLNFNGIGVYPHWRIAGKEVGGLHLDMRGLPVARWMGVLESGKQVYQGLNKSNLKKYGVS